jgi:Uma2 family endonuclease
MWEILTAWAGERGEVGVEWRFHLDPDAQRENCYVPDVAYVSLKRLAPLDDERAEEPPFAPDIAVEIRSPGDRERNVAKKIERYLEYGAALVLDVDPSSATIVAHARDGVSRFTGDDTFRHHAATGLTFTVAAYFAVGDRLREPQ